LSSAMSMASTYCIELASLAVKMSSQWPYSLHTASLMMAPASITTLRKC